MANFNFFKLDELLDADPQIAIIAARYQGKWVFCRHKQRKTWEMPGGHREYGETIADAAKRELWEETGATEFDICPVLVCCDDIYCGMIYYAEVKEFERIPDESEMEEIKFFDGLPNELTYPDLYKKIYMYLREWIHIR